MPEQPDQHRVNGRKRFGPLPVLALYLAIVVVPLGAYYFVYYPNALSYRVGWYFRILDEVADQAASRLEQIRTFRRFTLLSQENVRISIDEPLTYFFEWPQGASVRLKVVPKPIAACPASERAFRAIFPTPEDPSEIAVADCVEPRIEARLAFADLFALDGIAVDDAAPFDQVLVGHQGEVVHHAGDSFPRIADVDGLKDDRPRDGFAGAPPSGPASTLDLLSEKLGLSKPEKRPKTSEMREVTLAGGRYRVFVVPFVLPAVGAEPFHLYGIVDDARFRSGIGQVSLPTLGVVFVLLLLGILSWPYLRIVLISPREKLRAIDAHYLMASLVLGSGLAAVLIMHGVAYHNMIMEADDELDAIATKVRREFAIELRDALRTIRRSRARLWGARAGGNAPATRDDRAARCRIDESQGDYPAYESMFAIARDSRQTGEIDQFNSVLPLRKGFPIPPGRDYLDRAKGGPLWRDLHGQAPALRRSGFFVERIRAAQQGASVSIIAQPWREPGDPTPPAGDEPVAVVLGKRFLSLWSPVLPPATGFAVVDPSDGRVLYHSDDERSLVENFYVETDHDARLRVAIGSRKRDELEGRYKGVQHHFRVEPLADVPWSLVVFRDKRLLQTLQFELLVAAASAFVIYGFLFGISVVVVSWCSSETRWSWIWPQRKGERAYWSCLAVLFGVGGAYAGVLEQPACEGPPATIVVLLAPVATVSALYLRLKPRAAFQHWRRSVAASALAASFVGLGVAGRCLLLEWAPLSAAILASCLGVAALIARNGPRIDLRGWIPSIEPWRALYLGCAFASVVVLAGLPAWAIFGDAHGLVAAMQRGHRQESLARALRRHDEAVQIDASRLCAKFGGPARAAIQLPRKKRGIYVPPNEVRAASAVQLPCPVTRPCVLGSWKEARMGLWMRHPTAFLLSALPVYNEWVGDLRRFALDDGTRPRLVVDDDPEGAWPWVIQPVGSAASQCAGGPPAAIQLGPSDGPPRYGIAIKDDLNLLHVPRGLIELSIWIIVVLLAVSGVWLALRSLARRVLGLDIPDFAMVEPSTDPTELVTASRLLVRPPSELATRLADTVGGLAGGRVIEFPRPGARRKMGSWLKERCAGGTVFLFRNFEMVILGSAKDRRAVLECLEELVRTRSIVLICSSVSPIYGLVTHGAYPDIGRASAASTGDESVRWGSLFAVLRKGRFAPRTAPTWSAIPHPARARLARECVVLPELREVQARIEVDPAYAEGRLTELQIVEYVADLAEPHYRRIWALCTTDERLALIDLARGYLVNPQNVAVLERLLRRGLILRSPHFEIMNKSFGRFVVGAEPRERVAAWQREAADSAWLSFRGPMLAVLILIGAFLLYTVRQALDEATIGIVTGTLASLPLLLRLLSGGAKTGQGQPS